MGASGQMKEVPMPELPDLEIIREVLTRRIVGQRIEEAEIVRPLVVRPLDPCISAEAFLTNQIVESVARRGKFLLFVLSHGGRVAINLMLAGRLRYCPRQERCRVRDYVLLHFAHGWDVRYHDPMGMGKIYLTYDLDLIPGYAEMGPDALDPELSLERFIELLKPHRGEIKGILTRGQVAAGIGNAYADEILFRAGLYPFRKRTSLSRDETAALYQAMRDVLNEAIPALRERVGEEIHNEVRDFLQVHNRKGQPCPRCGQTISEIKVEQRATSFCRHCQPGSLLRN